MNVHTCVAADLSSSLFRVSTHTRVLPVLGERSQWLCDSSEFTQKQTLYDERRDILNSLRCMRVRETHFLRYKYILSSIKSPPPSHLPTPLAVHWSFVPFSLYIAYSLRKPTVCLRLRYNGVFFTKKVIHNLHGVFFRKKSFTIFPEFSTGKSDS